MKMNLSMLNTPWSLALVAAATFQALVLVGILARAALPMWTGTEIRVDTIPVDPRSLFRGNYARLRYRFSEVDASQLTRSETPWNDSGLRDGEVVYVSLAPTTEGKYDFADVSLERPQEGIFLRGRLRQGNRRWARETLAVDYGIEAFFAPKEEALALESELRGGGVAVLMVSDSGRARLKEILPR